MSMDLYLWKSPVTGDPDEAAALLDRHLGGDAKVFEPSTDIARVSDELCRLYPFRLLSNAETLAAMSEEERGHYTAEELAQLRHIEGGEPWADLPFDQSDRLLVLSVRWGADDRVLDDIVRLGREHELVIYDPQGPSVYLPDDPEEQQPVPPPTLADAAKMLVMAAGLVALTYAAWLIPIGWIRWPAVVIAGFVAAAGLFVLWLTVGGALGWINDDPPR